MGAATDKSKTVSDKVIGQFLNVLETEEGFEEIAARLRKTIIDEQVISDKALRDALFEEDSV